MTGGALGFALASLLLSVLITGLLTPMGALAAYGLSALIALSVGAGSALRTLLKRTKHPVNHDACAKGVQTVQARRSS